MRRPGERIVVKSWLSFSGLRDSRGQYDTIGILERKQEFSFTI
nr:MAG TPA: hypothetical protein [Caudoviricetes sp.]